jgi:hypothetical protein
MTPRLGRNASARLRRFARPLNDALDAAFGLRLVDADAAGVRVNEEWIERLLYFDRLLERLDGVDGDVVECGVAAGQSLAMLASLVRDRGSGRRLYGFDSWQGLPEPGEQDFAGGAGAAEQGMFGWASARSVPLELRGHGFRADEIEELVTLVEGDFADTVGSFELGSIALLHLDADLYDSYRIVLERLWPRVAVGGIAAFDEYGEPETWPGAARAVDEFVQREPRAAVELCFDERARKWYAVKRST